ncbi:hypothetical protein HG531_010866 [Fusarium graminearum]|nr:hypothetical protein HG531_010866 [Fusarium graminearum]
MKRKTLAEPETDDRLSIITACAVRGPTHIVEGLLNLLLLVSVEGISLVPLAISSAVEFETLVLLRVCIGAAETLEEIAQLGAGGNVGGNEWDLCVGIELPGRGLALEDMDFGMLGREKVVVAGLATHAAGRIGHLCGRHLGIDLRVSLCLSGKDVPVAVGTLVVRFRVDTQAAKKDLGTPKSVAVAVVEGSYNDPGPERRISRCYEMLRDDELGCRCRKLNVLDCPTIDGSVVRHGGSFCNKTALTTS